MQLIIVCETRSSSKSDYKYIKSVLDYFYEPRSFSIKKIFASSKTSLIKQDSKISKIMSSYSEKSFVVLFADVDSKDDQLNNEIMNYARNRNFALVWMNQDVEDVFLGKSVNKKIKNAEADNYLKRYHKILPLLTIKLEEKNPLEHKNTSNILVVFDNYLERKDSLSK